MSDVSIAYDAKVSLPNLLPPELQSEICSGNDIETDAKWAPPVGRWIDRHMVRGPVEQPVQNETGDDKPERHPCAGGGQDDEE